MSTEELNNIMDKVLSLPAEAVKTPTYPIQIYIQEAENHYKASIKDKADLNSIGITDELIESILPLAGALQQAESNWLDERDNKEQSQIEWQDISKDAYEIRDIVLHKFFYAYRNTNNIIKKLRHIEKGRSHADMIQDLSDLATIGRNHQDELIQTNFDITLLDKAQEYSNDLGLILATVITEDKGHESKDIRDRVYTLLKIVIDDIKAAGQSLFWRTPEKLKFYRSQYIHNKNSKAKNGKDKDSLAA